MESLIRTSWKICVLTREKVILSGKWPFHVSYIFKNVSNYWALTMFLKNVDITHKKKMRIASRNERIFSKKKIRENISKFIFHWFEFRQLFFFIKKKKSVLPVYFVEWALSYEQINIQISIEFHSIISLCKINKLFPTFKRSSL